MIHYKDKRQINSFSTDFFIKNKRKKRKVTLFALKCYLWHFEKCNGGSLRTQKKFIKKRHNFRLCLTLLYF